MRRRETPSEMGLRRGLIQLLTSTQVQAIDFSMSGIQINGYIFRLVADALNAGSIMVEIDRARMLRRNAEASYDAATNTFIFKNATLLSSIDGRSTAVHESVHAGVDIVRYNIRRHSNEALAFVAMYLYQMNGTEFSLPDISIPERYEAWQIATALLPRTVLSQQEVQRIMGAVEAHYTHYPVTERARADGIQERHSLIRRRSRTLFLP